MFKNRPKTQIQDTAPDPFNRAVPGFSLTQEPGKWPWEKPPQHVDPSETVDSIIDKLEVQETRDEVASLMAAGISIEEITSILAVHGVNRGKFNPDLAEMIKGPLAFYLLGMADEYGIPVKLFGNEEAYREKKAGYSNMQILQLMKNRNPALYETVMYGQAPEQDQALERYRKTSEDSFLVEEEPTEMDEEPQEDMREDEE